MEESPRGSLIAVALLLLAAGAGAWVFMAVEKEPPAQPKAAMPENPPPPVAEQAAEAPPEPPPPAPAPVPPPVEERPDDVRIRELAVGLSAEPEWVHWLAGEHLLDKFVAVVENLANGQSPRKLLAFMAPEGRFEVFERQGVEYLDPKGYARYDRHALAFASLDEQKAAGLFAKLKPWLNQAYAQLGRPGRSFEQALADALQQLADVPLVEGDIPLSREEVNLKFQDPDLEGMSQAQKHLFRMGPGNIRRVKAKLEELRGALGLPRPSDK